MLYLVKETGVQPGKERLEFIGKLNNASIPTRYPDDLQTAVQQYPKQVAYDYLQKTEEVNRWIRALPILKP